MKPPRTLPSTLGGHIADFTEILREAVITGAVDSDYNVLRDADENKCIERTALGVTRRIGVEGRFCNLPQTRAVILAAYRAGYAIADAFRGDS